MTVETRGIGDTIQIHKFSTIVIFATLRIDNMFTNGT